MWTHQTEDADVLGVDKTSESRILQETTGDF